VPTVVIASIATAASMFSCDTVALSSSVPASSISAWSPAPGTAVATVSVPWLS
jgi:hypothetical protein